MKFNGEKLRLLRLRKRLSGAELGKLAGVTNQTISYLESGGRNPSHKSVQDIARALGVDASELYDMPRPDSLSSDGIIGALVRYGFRTRGKSKLTRGKVEVKITGPGRVALSIYNDDCSAALVFVCDAAQEVDNTESATN